jgi:hypothetical protein
VEPREGRFEVVNAFPHMALARPSEAAHRGAPSPSPLVSALLLLARKRGEAP